MEGEDGSDFLLIGHEMLYFGRDMDRSLINQNQVRHHIRHRSGSVQDDYTQSDVPFGINTGDAFIPFYTAGCAVTFDSQTPTSAELGALPQIVITSKEVWDPKRNLVQVTMLQALSPPKQHNDYETDTILAMADPTLSKYLLVERAVSSIQISTHFKSNDTADVVPCVVHQDDTKQHALGRWLGVSHQVGSALCYWILTHSGKVISSTTVNHVTQADTRDPHTAQHICDFDSAVWARLEDTNFTSNDIPGDSPYIEDYSPPEDAPRRGVIPSDTKYGDMIVEEPPDDDEHEDLDNYIHAQLLLDVGNGKLQGRVTQRVRAPDGSKKGKPHKNPMFDTRAYLVEFSDGSVSKYTANIIAENIYSQVDQEGRSFAILSEICGHKHDRTVIPKGEGFHTSHNGNRSPKKTTRGWKLQVLWKDGTTEWVSLKALKESNPVVLVEYAKAHHIDDEPAFYWWVRDVLRKRQRIIGKLKSKYWRTMHKFGIRLPKDTREALQIDEDTGTDFWKWAIEKELRQVKVAWEARDDLNIEQVRSGKQLIGYTEIVCHMVFDVKIDFTRKAPFCSRRPPHRRT